jgi:hypothetical protein
LLGTVETVNGRLADNEREAALLAIEPKLAEIDRALTQIHASAELRNKTLYPLQQLKLKIAGLTSIPQIRYLAEQASTLLDEAMDKIAASQKQLPVGGKEPGTTTISKPSHHTAPKPVKVVNAQALSSKTYLETEAEVDAYLAKLRQELVAILQEGKKARIQ